MARGFGSTFGSGTTDLIDTTATASVAGTTSWWSRFWINGLGGGGFGRIFDKGNTAVTNTGVIMFIDADELAFRPGWSGNGVFSTAKPSNSTWHSWGVSYNSGATTNDPIFYLDGTKITSLAEVPTPSGTFDGAAGSIFQIGNRTAGDRNWDGLLADLAVWNVILTDEEFAALQDGYSPLVIRPQSLLEYVPLIRDVVSYKRSGALTVTGTVVQPHYPGIIMPRDSRQRIVKPKLRPLPEVLVPDADMVDGQWKPRREDPLKLLLHCDGADAATVFKDSGGYNKAVALFGGEVDTAQSKFGGASFLVNAGRLECDGSDDFAFGVGDFTIDCWVRLTGNTGFQSIYDSRAAGDGAYVSIAVSDGELVLIVNGSNQIVGTTTLSTGTWHHVALARKSGKTKMFLNGTQEGSTYTDLNSYLNNIARPRIGEVGTTTGFTVQGWIDEVRILKGVAAWDANFTPPTAAYNDGPGKALFHMDGGDTTTVFADAVAERSGRTFTAVGNAQVDTAQSKFGGASLLLDGTGDYLQGDGSKDFEFRTHDYTIDFWLRLNASGANQVLYDTRSTGSEYFALYVANDNRLRLFNNGDVISGGTALSTGTWHHIALTRRGASTRLFLNGIQEGSTYTDTNVHVTYPDRPLIGSQIGATNFVNGWIDELRILKGKAAWVANFTPPTGPYTEELFEHVHDRAMKLLLHFEGADGATTTEDSSGYQRIQISFVGNAQIDNAQAKFGATSALCAGHTGAGYLLLNRDKDLEFGTGDFTIDLWFRPDSSGVFHFLYDGGVFAAANGVARFFVSSDNKFYYTVDGNNLIISTTQVVAGQWYHAALVRRANRTSMFVNGTREGVVADNNYFSFRRQQDAAACIAPTGWVDEVRILKGVAAWTENFQPLDAPYPDGPGSAIGVIQEQPVRLLMHFDGADAGTTFLDSAGQHTFTAQGNAQLDTAQSKFGVSSLLLDGAGDFLQGSGSQDFAFGAGDFTIDCWVRRANTSAFHNIFDTRPSVATGPYLTIYIEDNAAGNKVRVYADGADRITGITALAASTWYHVAVTRRGTSLRLFINGTQEGSTFTDTIVYLLGSVGPYIGINSDTFTGGGMNGWIDELRVIKGQAAWIANFTPPTAPHTIPSYYSELPEPPVRTDIVQSGPGLVSDATEIRLDNPGFTPLKPLRVAYEFRRDTPVPMALEARLVQGEDVSLLLHGDGPDGSSGIGDSSGRALTISLSTTPEIDTAQSKFGGASINFTDHNDGINVSSREEDRFAFYMDGDFTIDFWVRFGTPGSDQFFVRVAGMELMTNSAATGFHFRWAGASRIGDGAVSGSTWYHIALVRRGTTHRLFKDGVKVGSDYVASTIYSQTSNPVQLGFGFNGWLDEVRVVKGRAVWFDENFTPPTAAYSDHLVERWIDYVDHDHFITKEQYVEGFDSRTKLLMHFDGADAATTFPDSSYYNRPVTVSGNAQIDTDQSVFGGASMLLDGTGDFLTWTLTDQGRDDLAFGSEDFTIDFRFRPAGVDGSVVDNVMDFRTTSNQMAILIWQEATALHYHVANGNRISSSALSANTWYHVAVARKNGLTRMFINGTQQGSTYTDTNYYMVGGNVSFGGPGTNAHGHVDELRIVKGEAIWFQNFTPPASAHNALDTNVKRITDYNDLRVKLVAHQADPLALLGSDLVLWLDANKGAFNTTGGSLATDGQTVQQWQDQSSYQHHVAQATGGNRPTYRTTGLNSRAALQFVTASSNVLETASNAFTLGASTTRVTVYAVASLNAAGDDYCRLVSYTGSGSAGDYNSTLSFVMTQNGLSESILIFRNTAPSPPLSTPFGSPFLVQGLFGNNFVISDTKWRVFSAFDGSAGLSFASAGTMRIGAPVSSPTNERWDGMVSEVLVIRRHLSETERLIIDTYLRNKWGFPT